jgi:hypothetical protein
MLISWTLAQFYALRVKDNGETKAEESKRTRPRIEPETFIAKGRRANNLAMSTPKIVGHLHTHGYV